VTNYRISKENFSLRVITYIYQVHIMGYNRGPIYLDTLDWNKRLWVTFKICWYFLSNNWILLMSFNASFFMHNTKVIIVKMIVKFLTIFIFNCWIIRRSKSPFRWSNDLIKFWW